MEMCISTHEYVCLCIYIYLFPSSVLLEKLEALSGFPNGSAVKNTPAMLETQA